MLNERTSPGRMSETVMAKLVSATADLDGLRLAINIHITVAAPKTASAATENFNQRLMRANVYWV